VDKSGGGTSPLGREIQRRSLSPSQAIRRGNCDPHVEDHLTCGFRDNAYPGISLRPTRIVVGKICAQRGKNLRVLDSPDPA
jgi:hypothetical protein